MEELEAIDWYDQRVEAAGDSELKKILAHNRDEEKEHAAMMLEWLRRHDPKLDEHLRTYLFTNKSVLEIEDEAEGKDEGGSKGDGSLGIGSLRS
jgi:ferritin-like protein